MKILHIAVSLSPSAGVVHQMEWEQLAAQQLEIDWTVNLITPKKINSPIVIKSPTRKNLVLQYYTLRTFSYKWLSLEIPKYDLVLLRHSVHDIWEKSLLNKFKHIITVHHTLEVHELRNNSIFGNTRALMEKFIGQSSLQNVKGIIAVTREILDYEVKRLKNANIPNLTLVYPNGFFLTKKGN